MNYPTKYTVKQIVHNAMHGPTCEIKGQWLHARPLGYRSWRNRFRYAWLVFTGVADVVIWPEDQPNDQ